MMPLLEEIESELKDDIRMSKINVDNIDNQEIIDEYQIMTLPTIKIFKDGKVIGNFIGLKNKEMLVKDILSLIKT